MWLDVHVSDLLTSALNSCLLKTSKSLNHDIILETIELVYPLLQVCLN